MTLYEILDKISKTGIKKKLINYAATGLSLYEVNGHTVKDYPLLFSCPNGGHQATRDTTTYNITLTVADRLEKDSQNDLQIFSYSIEILKDLITAIRDIEGVVDVSERYRITNFTETEKFSDRLAGAYAQIEITVINDEVCTSEEE